MTLIERARAVVEQAGRMTPAPWEDNDGYIAAKVPGGRPNGETIINCLYPRFDFKDGRANATDIVSLRNSAPTALAALVEEVERLRGTLERLRPREPNPCPLCSARWLNSIAGAGQSIKWMKHDGACYFASVPARSEPA